MGDSLLISVDQLVMDSWIVTEPSSLLEVVVSCEIGMGFRFFSWLLCVLPVVLSRGLSGIDVITYKPLFAGKS